MHVVRGWQNIFPFHSRNSRHARIQSQTVEARECYLTSDLTHAWTVPTAIPYAFHCEDFSPTTGTNLQLEYSRLNSELQVSEICYHLGIRDSGRTVRR